MSSSFQDFEMVYDIPRKDVIAASILIPREEAIIATFKQQRSEKTS